VEGQICYQPDLLPAQLGWFKIPVYLVTWVILILIWDVLRLVSFLTTGTASAMHRIRAVVFEVPPIPTLVACTRSSRQALQHATLTGLATLAWVATGSTLPRLNRWVTQGLWSRWSQTKTVWCLVCPILVSLAETPGELITPASAIARVSPHGLLIQRPCVLILAVVRPYIAALGIKIYLPFICKRPYWPSRAA